MMRRFNKSVVLLLSLLRACAAGTTTIPQHGTHNTNCSPAPYHVLHQFPKPTWLENTAVRPNGQILVTDLTDASVYQVSPWTPPSQSTTGTTNAAVSSATLIHSFAPFKAVLGITELQPDNFYVIVGNFSVTPTLDFGYHTFAIFNLDLRSYNPISNSGALTSELLPIPDALTPNGLTTLSLSKNLLLFTDSSQGVIYLLDVATKQYRLFLNETETAPASSPGTGVNGIKVLPGETKDQVWIYFDNTSKSLFARVPVSLSTLTKTGPVEVLSSGVGFDDFALDPEDGFAYQAAGSENAVFQFPLNGGGSGERSILGGPNSSVVAGPTSVAVGRGPWERDWIFVTTDGGLLGPINGSYTEGGKVLAVDVRGCR